MRFLPRTRRASVPPLRRRRVLGAERLEARNLLATWYVATNGSSTNDGSFAAPWDIESALTNTTDVQGGDTILIRGGTYQHPDRSAGTVGYAISLQGDPGSSITIQPYQNERVTIDGGLHSHPSIIPRHIVIQELEVIVSENLGDSRVVTTAGSNGYAELNRPDGGINVTGGHDIKLINNVIHANRQGVGFWGQVSGDSELYGNLIYDNGWVGPDRNHGHGVYTQNATPDFKYIRDNIFVGNWSLNMQAYGSSAARVDRFEVERNIHEWTPLSDDGGILIGGEFPSQTIRYRDNIGYGGDVAGNARIGYVDGGIDAIVTGNRIWSGLSWTQFTNLTASDNFVWQNDWSTPRYDGVSIPIPQEPFIFVNPNAYDADRANLAIMNFQSDAHVAVDFSGFLNSGDTFELRDPTDFYGAPFFQAVYAGSPVMIPVNGDEFSAFVVLRDDPGTAGITVSPTSGLTTTEAGGTATFTVVLNNQPTANVTVPISSSDTTEGIVSTSSLTFTPANWSAPQTVTITGQNDHLDDSNVSYTIVIASAISSDAAYSGINPSDVSLTNTDDDTAGITVSPTSGLTTTEAGGTAGFTVVLNSQPISNVTVPVSSSDTTEGIVSASSLIFTSANWNTPQTVTVTGQNDALNDGNVDYTIVTHAASSSGAAYNGMNPADVSVRNMATNPAGITVSPRSGLTTTEAGGTATFTVVLNSQPTANVTVPISSSDTTEGTVSVSSLTFTMANWNTLQTITITGQNDHLDDSNVNYTIVTGATTSSDAAYSGINPADVSVTNTDDDTAGITVSPTSGLVTTETGGTATFTVVLNSQPISNVTLPISSSDATEGTVSASSLTFTPATWNAPQTVTITGQNDALDDDNISYTIVTGASTSTGAAYNGRNPSDVSVTNTDDDMPSGTVKFFVVDKSADRTFSYDAAGFRVTANHLTSENNDPRDIATNSTGSIRWVIDADRRVYVYDANGGLMGSWLANGLSKPEGIATDGQDIWIADLSQDRVFFYAGAAGQLSGSLAPSSSFVLRSGNKSPYGVTTDGTSLWVLNSTKTSDHVFKYTTSGDYLGSWRLDTRNHTPRGLAIDPNHVEDLWVVDSSTDKIYEYDNGALALSGNLTAVRTFKLDSQNSSAQGISDPVFTYPYSELAGDMNLDSDLDFDDIDSLLLGLNDRATYEAAFGVPPSHNGDVDGDGDLDIDDLSRWQDLLISLSEPTGDFPGDRMQLPAAAAMASVFDTETTGVDPTADVEQTDSPLLHSKHQVFPTRLFSRQANRIVDEAFSLSSGTVQYDSLIDELVGTLIN